MKCEWLKSTFYSVALWAFILCENSFLFPVQSDWSNRKPRKNIVIFLHNRSSATNLLPVDHLSCVTCTWQQPIEWSFTRAELHLHPCSFSFPHFLLFQLPHLLLFSSQKCLKKKKKIYWETWPACSLSNKTLWGRWAHSMGWCSP